MVASELMFVSELRLGFGSFVSSNICQRYSNAHVAWVLERFDELERQADDWNSPDNVRWRAMRQPLEDECREKRPKRASEAMPDCNQSRTCTIHMFTDDPISMCVGVASALRLIAAWAQINEEIKLLMAADKRQLGAHVEWIGILMLLGIGLVVVPKSKLLRARDGIKKALAGTAEFGDYRSLIGLLEHLRHVAHRTADTVNALYRPHGKGGAWETGPSTIVEIDSAMRAALELWDQIIMMCGGALVSIVIVTTGAERLRKAASFFAGSADAAADGKGSPGIGGYLHGFVWRVGLNPKVLALMHITGWEYLASAVNAYVADRLAGPDVTLWLRGDAVLIPYALTTQKSKSRDVQFILKQQLDDPHFEGIARRLVIDALSGDGNVPADLSSRALWDAFKTMAGYMGVRPYTLDLTSKELGLVHRTILNAAAAKHIQLQLSDLPHGSLAVDGIEHAAWLQEPSRPVATHPQQPIRQPKVHKLDSASKRGIKKRKRLGKEFAERVEGDGAPSERRQQVTQVVAHYLEQQQSEYKRLVRRLLQLTHEVGRLVYRYKVSLRAHCIRVHNENQLPHGQSQAMENICNGLCVEFTKGFVPEWARGLRRDANVPGTFHLPDMFLDGTYAFSHMECRCTRLLSVIKTRSAQQQLALDEALRMRNDVLQPLLRLVDALCPAWEDLHCTWGLHSVDTRSAACTQRGEGPMTRRVLLQQSMPMAAPLPLATDGELWVNYYASANDQDDTRQCVINTLGRRFSIVAPTFPLDWAPPVGGVMHPALRYTAGCFGDPFTRGVIMEACLNDPPVPIPGWMATEVPSCAQLRVLRSLSFCRYAQLAWNKPNWEPWYSRRCLRALDERNVPTFLRAPIARDGQVSQTVPAGPFLRFLQTAPRPPNYFVGVWGNDGDGRYARGPTTAPPPDPPPSPPQVMHRLGDAAPPVPLRMGCAAAAHLPKWLVSHVRLFVTRVNQRGLTSVLRLGKSFAERVEGDGAARAAAGADRFGSFDGHSNVIAGKRKLLAYLESQREGHYLPTNITGSLAATLWQELDIVTTAQVDAMDTEVFARHAAELEVENRERPRVRDAAAVWHRSMPHASLPVAMPHGSPAARLARMRRNAAYAIVIGQYAERLQVAVRSELRRIIYEMYALGLLEQRYRVSSDAHGFACFQEQRDNFTLPDASICEDIEIHAQPVQCEGDMSFFGGDLPWVNRIDHMPPEWYDGVPFVVHRLTCRCTVLHEEIQERERQLRADIRHLMCGDVVALASLCAFLEAFNPPWEGAVDTTPNSSTSGQSTWHLSPQRCAQLRKSRHPFLTRPYEPSAFGADANMSSFPYYPGDMPSAAGMVPLRGLGSGTYVRQTRINAAVKIETCLDASDAVMRDGLRWAAGVTSQNAYMRADPNCVHRGTTAV